MSLSPTQLTLRQLRADGYTAQVVEHWNNFAKVRQDLFKIHDVLRVGNGETIGIQCTSYSNMAVRVKKVNACEAIADIRSAGWKVLVHGWHKKKNRWVCREFDCSDRDIETPDEFRTTGAL